jgi:thiol:disulfide interchange protein DsbD
MRLLVYRRVLAVVFLFFFAIGSAWGSAGLFSWQEEAEFLDPVDVFKLAQVQQQGTELAAQGHIAENYYVYRHSLKLVSGQGEEVRLDLPPGTPKNDEFFGDTEIYLGDALRLRFPASVTGPLTLHWQGCAEGGICYPPQTMALNLPAMAAGASSAAEPPATTSQPKAGAGGAANVAEDQAAAQRLATLGPIAGTLLFFGFGLLLAFTPCTLPMIPIISSMVVGAQASPRRAFVTSLSYVLAMAATYAAVGVAAGLAGANLQATLQSPWLLGAFAALFLILASSLFGMFELRLPSALLNRVGSANQGRAGGNVVGAAALGFLSALLVGPCMTAPLAGALLYISQTGSALYGGLALFALGLGMGLPLLVIAIFGARVLPKPGAWMVRVRIAFGYVMVGMAVMMLDRFLPATLSLALWGAWILSIAIGLLAWAQAVAQKLRLMWALRTLGAIAGLWSILMLVGAASGGDSLSQPLAHLRAASSAAVPAIANKPAYVEAKSVEDVDRRLADAAARGQWTLIDFYADWCISCHVIERNVFGDPAVAQRLARMQVLRPDVTRNDATDQALLKRWGVMGPPTLILVGPDGTERRDLRVVGEVSAADFLARLNKAGTP